MHHTLKEIQQVIEALREVEDIFTAAGIHATDVRCVHDSDTSDFSHTVARSGLQLTWTCGYSINSLSLKPHVCLHVCLSKTNTEHERSILELAYFPDQDAWKVEALDDAVYDKSRPEEERLLMVLRASEGIARDEAFEFVALIANRFVQAPQAD